MAEATKRYAVVTGANKGIGFAICKQLASKGIIAVLTATNEKLKDLVFLAVWFFINLMLQTLRV
ncbi:hypothetical protein JHK82_043508 [Glycine max]|nr:hypothetical protein JHK87_043290 [Glycine soja]KAG4950160.1 hypothetical protein JHK86_043399 [Glycine max]KAG5106538.1 hypothetical protein JHK82_043508 [Glycine max]KAG5117466.1 hypothetical protein JHK84_043579 [Glycine max]